jgi:hypothetical protein
MKTFRSVICSRTIAYKDKSSDVGKWLSKFFGLPFLSENEVKDSFAEDIMFNAPDDDNCSKFAD